MGSPAGEAGRSDDEGPQRKVKISPFWMGKYELTWNEYHKFMYYQKKKAEEDSEDWWLEEVATPTKPYVNMDFGMGTGTHPAICMTHHAANKYCQWLSAKTGIFTGCRPKPNGNTPHGREPPPLIPGATKAMKAR